MCRGRGACVCVVVILLITDLSYTSFGPGTEKSTKLAPVFGQLVITAAAVENGKIPPTAVVQMKREKSEEAEELDVKVSGSRRVLNVE